MKRIYFFVAILMAMFTSCNDISNASVKDIEKACQKEDWATAKKMCEGFVKKDRTNPIVFKCLGDAYLGLKDSSLAQYSYDQAVALDSSYVEAMVCSADIIMNRGNAELAIRQLRSQMELIPNNAQLHNALGCAFRLADNLPEAQANFEQAVQLDGEYLVARKNLAVLQIDNRDLDDAILNLETMLDINPNQADVYTCLGLAYAFQSKQKEAEEMFLKAISIDDKCIMAYENLAYHYEHYGDLKSAKKNYEKAAELGSQNAKQMLQNKKFSK